MTTLTTIPTEEAKALLSSCHLHICKDRYFGDAEYHWTSFDDNRQIAEGYFGGGKGHISFLEHTNKYTEQDAIDMRNLYYSVSTSYNDLRGE